VGKGALCRAGRKVLFQERGFWVLLGMVLIDASDSVAKLSLALVVFGLSILAVVLVLGDL